MKSTTSTTSSGLQKSFASIHWGQILAFLNVREVMQVTLLGKTVELGAYRFLRHRYIDLTDRELVESKNLPWFEGYLRRSACVAQSLTLRDDSQDFEMGKLFYKLLAVGLPRLETCRVRANFEAVPTPKTLALPYVSYIDMAESRFHDADNSIKFILRAPNLHSLTLRGRQVRLFDHPLINYRVSNPRPSLALFDPANDVYGLRGDVSPSLVLRYEAAMVEPNVVLTLNRACGWCWKSMDQVRADVAVERDEWTGQMAVWREYVDNMYRLLKENRGRRIPSAMVPKLDPKVREGVASCSDFVALEGNMDVKRKLRPLHAQEVVRSGTAWEELHTVDNPLRLEEDGLDRLPVVIGDLKVPDKQQVIDWEPSRAENIASDTTSIAWLNIKSIRREDRESLLQNGSERLKRVQNQIQGPISLEIDEGTVEDEILTLEALIRVANPEFLLLCNGFRSTANLLRLYCLLYYLDQFEKRKIIVRAPAMQFFEDPWDEVLGELITGTYFHETMEVVLEWLGTSRRGIKRFSKLKNRENAYKQLREIARKGCKHPSYPKLLAELSEYEYALFEYSYRQTLKDTKEITLPKAIQFHNPLVGYRLMSAVDPKSGHLHCDDLIRYIAGRL